MRRKKKEQLMLTFEQGCKYRYVITRSEKGTYFLDIKKKNRTVAVMKSRDIHDFDKILEMDKMLKNEFI